MKAIYLDNDFRCHITNDGTFNPVETDFFDNKCDEFIEGYRYVPFGESWTREDGEVFDGEMIAPFVDYHSLVELQRDYERELLAEYESALAEIEKALGV